MGSDGKAGSFAAVGTFEKGIEVWNLDVLDPLEPSFTLGGVDNTEVENRAAQAMINDYNEQRNLSKKEKNKKRADKKKQEPKAAWSGGEEKLFPGSHTDAVMGLSWNKVHRQVIASGSADCTVKLWDVTNPQEPASTFTHHTGKVNSVAFHKDEGTILATGGFDKQVCVVDGRIGDGSAVRKGKVSFWGGAARAMSGARSVSNSSHATLIVRRSGAMWRTFVGTLTGPSASSPPARMARSAAGTFATCPRSFGNSMGGSTGLAAWPSTRWSAECSRPRVSTRAWGSGTSGRGTQGT